MSQAPPDLVIGVDFGMTQTGVAYCQAPWTNVKTFQSWSRYEHEVSNKVPTRVAYSRQDGSVTGWGLGCDLESSTDEIQEHFKLYLDPEYQDDYEDITHADAKKWFVDYLTQVHDHVMAFMGRRIPQLNGKIIEWVFSVPTTWRHPGLMSVLEHMLKRAGFGRDGYGHRVRITLTEAEAAAICVASQQMEQGDVIAVCDAGGGTTDVNILKVESKRGEPVRLGSLLPVKGRAVGSALIDIRVQQYLTKRLEYIANRLPAPPGEVAEKMMVGRFERFKCAYGTPGTDIPALPLTVPGLDPYTDIPMADIRNSQMIISQDLLRDFFDEQVHGMIDVLSEQMVSLQRKMPNERISYMVLSGGLGMSPYVRERLRLHFASEGGRAFPNAYGMQILLAENAMLAPVLGLVIERAQQLGPNVAAISKRCARLSFGVVVDQIYDPSNPAHINQPVVKDPRDKKKYARNQVEWLLYEGEEVDVNGISRPVKTKLHPSQMQLRKPWKAQFVQCSESRGLACPTNSRDPAVKGLCDIAVNLEGIDTKVMNGHWWNRRPRYELAEFEVRLVPGSADLQFQLWHQGRKISGENESVNVSWNLSSPIQTQVGNPWSPKLG